MAPLTPQTSFWTSHLCRICTHCSGFTPRLLRSNIRGSRKAVGFAPFSSSSSNSRRARASPSSNESTTSGPAKYPFPSRKNASPHEIFHLPRNATEADIKARYFDLVRLYHPDKSTDIPAEAAHSRFRAITAAYDTLRGKKASGSADDGVDVDGNNANVDLRYQTTAAWRAAHRKRQQELYSTGAADEKWKDRIILFGLVATVAFVIANTMTTRKEALAEALNRTRQFEDHRFQERMEQQEALKKQQHRARMEEESRLSADS